MSDRAIRLELERLRARCAQLQARCYELEPDATRYRVLRDATQNSQGMRPVVILIDESKPGAHEEMLRSVRYGLQLDTTIDRLAVQGAGRNDNLGDVQP